MRIIQNISAAALLVGSLAVVGCHKSAESAPEVPGPTTMMAPETNGNVSGVTGPTTMAVPSAKQTEVVLPATAPPAAKDLTHMLTKDEPFYLNEPGANPQPVGTLKAGTKVLVLIPGATFSQVITDKGISAYVPTDGLSPVGK